MLPNNALENLIHVYLAGGHIPAESHPCHAQFIHWLHMWKKKNGKKKEAKLTFIPGVEDLKEIAVNTIPQVVTCSEMGQHKRSQRQSS